MSVHARADPYGRRPPRRRPAPRRDAGRPAAGRIHWDRAGRIIFVLAVVVLAVLAIKPAWNLFHTYRLVGETEVRLQQAKTDTALLERRVKHARGDAVLRREARRQGMIGPGEQAWVVSGLKR